MPQSHGKLIYTISCFIIINNIYEIILHFALLLLHE